MYILSHFGCSYCVFQILIQMTVRPHIINTGLAKFDWKVVAHLVATDSIAMVVARQ